MQFVALPRAGQSSCQRPKMIVSTSSGLVNGPLCAYSFQPWTAENSRFSKLIFLIL